MPSKHALLIGVDEYCKLDAQFQLAGCVNDAKLVNSVLTGRFGFDPANVVQLHNSAASQAAILGAMDNLVDRVARDDVVVFHFSGHGSRRTSGNPEKASGKDSTIMPWDSGRRPDPNLDILDDEIHAWLQRLAEKTRYITLTFDCCHSGTITRDVFAGAVRGVEADTRSLADMGVDAAPLPLPAISSAPKAEKESEKESVAGWLGQSDAYVVISGCREDEKSSEYSHGDTCSNDGDINRNGALTFHLTQALNQAVPGSTYRDVFEQACLGVTTMFPRQHPQIEGQLDREVLGVQDIEPMRYVPLSALEGAGGETNAVTLAAGTAHGVLPGGQWAVYPPGTKTPRADLQVASIEIESVGALSSTARVIDSADALEIGSRCVEVAAPRITPMSVDMSALASAEAALLTRAMADSRLVDAVDAPEAADIRAYVIDPRSSVTADDPAPQLGALSERVWVMVGADGEPVMQTHPDKGEAAMLGVRADLELVAGYRNALQLNNPASAMDVAFNIYQEIDSGEWQTANGGKSSFVHGDSIAIEVINRMSVPIWVSIVQFSADKEISQLYPPNNDGERVEANGALTFGRDKRRIRLQMPDVAELHSGMETLKAFVSTESADFSWLHQKGAYDPKRRLRAAAIVEDEDPTDWTCISRTYELTLQPANPLS